MARNMRLIVSLLALMGVIVLVAILMFQQRLAAFDASLYTTMTAVR